MEPLLLPLGVAVEPLGCVVLLAPEELVSLDELELLLGEVVEPPEEVPLLFLSLSASVAAVLDELDDGLVALGDGLLALGELVELELEPALGELDGGVDGLVDDALLLEPGAGALEVLPDSFLLQAASPKASASAIANAESLMCSSRVGYEKRGEQGSDRV